MANFGTAHGAPTGARGRDWRIFSYFAPLTLLVTLISPNGNPADIAVGFM